MAQLIQLRHRIKAIETIKKITHAMRLISISTHARLKNKEAALTDYTNALSILFHTIKKEVPNWHHPYLHPKASEAQRPLIILIGSEKGLCGSFNTMLFQFLRATLRTYTQKPKVIIVGRKTLDYIDSVDNLGPIIKMHSPLTINTFSAIAQDIVTDILNAPEPYTNVTVISNKFKSFFVQQPHATRIVPFAPKTPREHINTDTSEYIWEESPEELLHSVAHQCATSTIHYLLFHSLIAEQAARFISMDSSTRSADGLLETNKLQYNKLRQAKITKELTELTGSF